MSQLQAIAFTVVFLLSIALALGLVMVVMTIKYEIEDRLKRRARRGYLPVERQVEQPPATIHPLAMARTRREQSDRRPAA